MQSASSPKTTFLSVLKFPNSVQVLNGTSVVALPLTIACVLF